MLNNYVVKSRASLLGSLFVALIAVVGLASCGGGNVVPNPEATIPPVSIPTALPDAIASVQAAWIAEPVRGTEYYYCDCGTGAESDCVEGDDANAGTSKSAPRRTIVNAVTLNNSIGSTLSTISFCKGGAFEVLSPAYFGGISCPAGSTCRDLREYEPAAFTGTAAPIIYKLATSVAGSELMFTNGGGGVRVFNMRLVGSGLFAGVMIYNGAHDVHIGNMVIEGFGVGLYSEISGPSAVTNIRATGNIILNNTGQGFLGSAYNLDLNNNYFSGNGGSTNRDHSIYLSSENFTSTNVSVVGNYIYGQYGPTCYGAPIVVHGEYDGMSISNNHIEIESAATTGGCWGISLSHGGYPTAAFFRNTVIGGNTIINGGNTAISAASAPGIVIENNLIINDWAYGNGWALLGIAVPVDAARTSPADDVNTANVIRNNTVWYSANTSGGGTGIRIAGEGSGHSVTNNSIVYTSSTVGQGVNCLDLPLDPGAYDAVDNNHCYSATTFKWEKTNGATLAAWKIYSGKDANSIAGSAPLFVNATASSGYDFKPNIGSPLTGAGSNTYKSTYDLLGVARPNPPAIGAFEP